MKNPNPKVSIVIPVYNGSNFLKEAIDSALAQTYKNIEVIVVDDGSTDKGATKKIAKSYGDKIRYYVKANGGVATALNLGIKKMTGEYFSWLSHDDMYEKTKIEDQINFLKSFKADDIIAACNARVLFPNGIKKEELIDKKTFEYIDIFLATSAVVGVNGCSLLIPKKALTDSGGFDVNLPVTQDYDLWFRLKDKYKFVLLEKNLVISRRHDKQDGVQKQKMSFEAGDKLHYDFLNNVAYGRFENFFKIDQKNIGSYWNNYTIYKLNGYKKTASMMLKHILKYYFENDIDKFYEVFNSEIGTIVKSEFIGTDKAKKRLMFYSNVWHMGGIERVLSFILANFSNKYDCILVINDDKTEANTGYPLPESVSYIKIVGRNQLDELINLVSTLDVDLFIGNPNISESFLDVYPLLNEAGVKSIAYNHGYYFLPYMCGEYLYPVALKTKEAYGSADYVIWLTQIACNIYNIENDNGVYIPNPAIVDPKCLPKKAVNKNVLAVGRFDDEIKQIDKTLLVFKELHKIDPEYHMDVVGYCQMDIRLSGWDNITLEDFIAKQNIPVDNITFWGEQKDMSKYYDNASFLILTSRCEGFGMVLLEALAKGVPCACFEYLGVEELVRSGYNGWVCPQDDYTGLVNNIIKTIEDKAVYLQMSENSLNSAKQFGAKSFYEKWEVLITSAINEDVDQLTSLKPDNKLTTADYRKITLEYEKFLKDVVRNYLTREASQVPESPKSISKMRGLTIRFKESIKRDGINLTAEKIARKLYSKTIKKWR